MALDIKRIRQREHLHHGIIDVEGSFQFNGSSNPTNVIGRGLSSVAHTSTGVWTVTLDSELQNAEGLVAMGVSLEADASMLSNLELGAFSASAGTVIVRAYTEASDTTALADIAAGSNRGNWCHLRLVLKFSDIEDGSGLV